MYLGKETFGPLDRNGGPASPKTRATAAGVEQTNVRFDRAQEESAPGRTPPFAQIPGANPELSPLVDEAPFEDAATDTGPPPPAASPAAGAPTIKAAWVLGGVALLFLLTRR